MRLRISGSIILGGLLVFGSGCGKDDDNTAGNDGGGNFQVQMPDQLLVEIRPVVAIPDTDIWVDIAGDGTDQEGLHYTYQWSRNGTPQDFPEDQTQVASQKIGTDSFWEVEVTAHANGAPGPTATAAKRVRPTDQTFTAGGSHACRIALNGVLRCWGSNTHGQLGDGSNEDRPAPTEVDGGGIWIAVAAGEQHTCGVRDDHTLWCWGHNNDNQVGRDGDRPQRTPIQVGTDDDWDKVSAGRKHSCAIRQDRTFWCWGDNLDGGQLGHDHIPGAGVPVQVGRHTHWLGLSSGWNHNCGHLSDGMMMCWGDNSQGQVGVDTDHTGTPTSIGDDSRWQHVSAGTSHSCGVTTDGEVWCWGSNHADQLGTASGSTSTPVRVGDDNRWYRVAAGTDHSCALRQNRTLWCWGNNAEGQIYSGSAATVATPVQVGNQAWAAVHAGDGQTCGITRDGGRLECWGRNRPQ